ncbi:MAG: single-stranded-DNA-specific exonuclease RecJ, partial [Anaerolineales bacterium]
MDWISPDLPDVPESFLNKLRISRFVGEILFRRGYTTVEGAKAFLFEDAYTPTAAAEISGLSTGVKLVGSAIREKKKIGVWGDFDVDGQTSTALLVSAFERLGGNVVFHVPVRAAESHGINLPNLKRMLAQGVEILVTCDTGISALEEVEFAKSQGVEVVLTDHHDIPDALPRADAIINPSMLDERHPLFTLPGVGVAYKFVEQLYTDWGIAEEVTQYLDLVALGIVADVAAIIGDTRYLLQRGIRALHTTNRLGLKVLMERAGVNQENLNEEDIGFSLAPRLNALGRLGDANVIVEFLTTTNESRVRVIAEQLEGLNAKRKLLTSQVYQAAEDQIYAEPLLNKASVLVLDGKEWPAGVVGIVASRIVEKYGKPTILLTTNNDGIYRGSARSVEGCDITEAITKCGDLLEGFGGHPMAAGLSLTSENLAAFRRCVDKTVQSQLGDKEDKSGQYDKLVSLDEVSMS